MDREMAARKILREMTGCKVEAVAEIHRSDAEEFAAVVISNAPGLEYRAERALEVLTLPRCPLRVVREYAGKTDTRWFVAWASPEARQTTMSHYAWLGH